MHAPRKLQWRRYTLQAVSSRGAWRAHSGKHRWGSEALEIEYAPLLCPSRGMLAEHQATPFTSGVGCLALGALRKCN
ncbi:hypothetical protein MRX96_037475 [Rhipicephalus microplus]